MSAREDLIGYALVALPNEPAFARCEQLADGFRDDVIREAIACLSGLADSVSERQRTGLDFAVGVLLDMVTGRDETTGGVR